MSTTIQSKRFPARSRFACAYFEGILYNGGRSRQIQRIRSSNSLAPMLWSSYFIPVASHIWYSHSPLNAFSRSGSWVRYSSSILLHRKLTSANFCLVPSKLHFLFGFCKPSSPLFSRKLCNKKISSPINFFYYYYSFWKSFWSSSCMCYALLFLISLFRC